MKLPVIEAIPLPESQLLRLKQRCSRRTVSTGTSVFGEKNHVCGKHARFKYDGIALCKLHAGEAALYFLVNNPTAEDIR